MTINFTERKDALKAKIDEYNEAVKANKASYISACKTAVNKAASALCEQAQQELCAEKKTSEHPMFEVLKAGEVDTYIGKIDSKTGKMSMVPAKKPVDIKVAWSFFFDAAPRLYEEVAKCLSACVTSDVAEGIEIDPAGLRYKLGLSDEVEALLGENADPRSTGSVQKVLQCLIDTIIGADVLKINRKSARVFREWMTGKGREHGETKIQGKFRAVKFAVDVIYCEANNREYTLKNESLVAEKAKEAKKPAETDTAESVA